MQKKLYYLILLLVFVLFNNAMASHIIGGGFTYRYLGNNLYQIQLDYYRDCGPTSADFPPAALKIGLFEKGTNSLVQNIQLEVDSTFFIDFGSLSCINSPVNCVQKREYSTILFLDSNLFADSLGYYLSYEQCCRNAVAVNVFEPQNSSIVFYMELPAFVNGAVFQENSSPVFENYPALLLCNSEFYEFSFSAFDLDGDSLVFSMVDPINGQRGVSNSTGQTDPIAGPYDPIVWNTGYGVSMNNIMDGNPDLIVDSSSGKLTVKPTKLGVFLAAVKCEEFRNGLKLGEVRRELELIVVECPNRFPPTISLVQDPALISYKANETLCFNLLVEDLNVLDSLQIFIDQIDPEFNSGEISFTALNGKSPQLVEFCFKPSCEIQLNDSIAIRFAALDGSCPNPLKTILEVKGALLFPEKFDFKNNMPTVFTPNSDGLNDVFKFPNAFPIKCANNFTLSIFNRWGKLLYQTNDPNFSWSGEGLSVGIYFVSIKLGSEWINSTLNLLR